MTMLENRMAIGEYYETETPYDHIVETAIGENYADFVESMGQIGRVLSSWLGIQLTEEKADLLWDSLERYKCFDICKAWVKRHMMDDFVQWIM